MHASVASSLSNLKTSDDETYLDCLVLHSPLPTIEDTYLVWSTLETYVPHKIRALGISYEVALRKFCQQEDIIYQSFWTLSGNPALLKSMVVTNLAEAAGVDREVALYTLVLGLGKICVLNGTTNKDHMKHDIERVKLLEPWAQGGGKDTYEAALKEFKALIVDV